MKPYWTSADGNLTIYHGDARDVLPELDLSGVDLVLTDPPYGVEGGAGNANLKRGKAKYRQTDWDDGPDYVGRVCVGVIRECIEHVGRVIVTPGLRMMMIYPQFDDCGTFWTPGSKGRGRWGFNTYNPIFYYGAGPIPRARVNPHRHPAELRPQAS